MTMPAAHAACLAMLAPVMTMNEGAAIHAPNGRLLTAGDRLHQPGLVRALEALAEEGPRSVYAGTVAESLLELVRERGGLVTRDDLAAYEARWSEPVEVEYAGSRVLTRDGLGPITEPLVRLVPSRASTRPSARSPWWPHSPADDDASAGHTTNVTVVDAEGSVCVLTTSLGLGSGDFLPGLDLHLNSMLGETDLIRGEQQPGAPDGEHDGAERSRSRDSGRPVLAAGAAGGTRLRSALVQVISGVLDEGLDVGAAIARPRLHPAGRLVHLEPGFEPNVPAALEEAGYEVRAWPAQHHYFGGVSAVTPSGGSGDPRRSGEARMLP